MAEHAGKTLAVCLDCTGRGDASYVVVPFFSQHGADHWVRLHRTVHPNTVTVPGWPPYTDAVTVAREHLAATPQGNSDD